MAYEEERQDYPGRPAALVLSDAGRKWCYAHQETSLIATVALYGDDTGWPDAFVEASRRVANDLGATA